ncbi:MAG: ParB/RepB/Spo0J family partition protein [Phycisphaerae bacterium]|nr:ParB/RepB/Spo0J family partition protein [Phycisphaerae bacterium]
MTEKSTSRPRHLGRGLQSLLGPMTDVTPEPTSKAKVEVFVPEKPSRTVQEIPIEAISVNPHQARTYWDEEKLQELAMSIQANGIVQPVVVRKTPTGYQLIAGERRFRASKRIGKTTIPAFIREATDAQMLEWALVENIHRADLNPIERAKAYQSYINHFSLNQTEAAKRLGEERSVLANHLRIFDLPTEVRQMLADGVLSMGHAKAILALPDNDLRKKIANRALAGRLSVRELEKLVREYLDGSNVSRVPRKEKAPHILELEGVLSSHLGSRVKIETQKKGHKGKMVIEFRTLDEFDSVLEKLGINNAIDM